LAFPGYEWIGCVFMRVAACLLVGADAQFRGTAERVARTEFPGVLVDTAKTVDDALQSGIPGGLEVLVLADPDPNDLAKAREATDASGLPRWAVVVLKENAVTEIPAAGGDLNADLLAAVFRSAAIQHELRRENARMRGDLCTMARRVMHDLRTPLGGILNATQALREALAEHSPSSTDLVKPLVESVRQMNRLMDRVSALARASAIAVVPVRVAMGDVLTRVMQGFELQIQRTGSVVEMADEWPEVNGAPDLLEMAWSELLGNALQYGGETPHIELDWDEAGSDYRFRVVSRGGTVPLEKLRNLFQPFHLLHQPNAKRGLGLSIVQRLLELQNGSCGCEPLAGSGMVFFFTLPGSRGLAGTDGRPAASESPCAGLSGICRT